MGDSQFKEIEFTNAGALARIIENHGSTAAAGKDVRTTPALTPLSQLRRDGSKRTAVPECQFNAVALDYDRGTSPGLYTALVDSLRDLGACFVSYTTASSTDDKPRFRLIIPLTRMVAQGEYRAAAMEVHTTIAAGLRLEGWVLPEPDQSALDPMSLLFMCSDDVRDGEGVAFPVSDNLFDESKPSKTKVAEVSRDGGDVLREVTKAGYPVVGVRRIFSKHRNDFVEASVIGRGIDGTYPCEIKSKIGNHRANSEAHSDGKVLFFPGSSGGGLSCRHDSCRGSELARFRAKKLAWVG